MDAARVSCLIGQCAVMLWWCAGTIVQAEVLTTETARLSAKIAAPHSDDKSLWMAICECELFCEPSLDSHSGQLEVIQSLPGYPRLPAYARTKVACDKESPCFMLIGPRNLPFAYAVGREFIQHNRGSGWQGNNGLWSVAIDSQHTSQFFNIDVAHNDTPTVAVDVAGFLSALFSEATPKIRKQSANYSLLLRLDDTVAELRLRTPDDQLRFGTLLAEVAVTESTGKTVQLTALTNQEGLPISLSFDEMQSLKDTLSISEDRKPRDSINVPVSDGADIRVAMRLWARLFSFKPLDSRPTTLNPEQSLQSRNQELLVGIAKSWNKKVLPELSEQPVPPSAAVPRAALKDELDRAYLNACLALSVDDAAQFVDDSTLVWRGFEVAVGPLLANQLVTEVLLPTLRSEDTPEHHRVELCREFARFGRPPWLLVEDFQKILQDSPFCGVVLKSRWHLPLDKDDIVLCVAKLDKEAAEIRYAAVEALLTAGECDLIPEDKLQSWVDKHIRKPEQNAQGWWKRHCSLHLMSMHSSGRRALLGELQSDVNSSFIKKEIVTVLVKRVQAARRLKRRDFMSVRESNEIVTVMNSTMAAIQD